MKTFLFIILTILVQHTIQYENAEEGNLLHPEKPPEEHEEDSHNLRKGDIKDLTNIKDYDAGDRQPCSKPPKKHEEDSHNLRRGDIKYLTNIKDTNIGDFQLYNGRYQNYYRELKDKEILRPLRELRSAPEIKNWVKGKRKGPYRPPQPTMKPRPPHTTHKSKGGRNDYMRISASFEFPEEQILLEYTPKHKKVDVPMIIFVPSRE